MTDRPPLFVMTSLSPALVGELEQRFTVHRGGGPEDTRAIVAGGASIIDADAMAALPKLEIIAINGVGYDGIDLEAARARGIRVTTTPDVLTEDVADQAIALMLAVQRRTAVNDRMVRDGGWMVAAGRQASRRRIGIFGLGRIGRAIARRAEPFAAELLYTARHAKPELPWRFVPDVRALAAASDVLILSAPGGEKTHHIVDGEVLAALGPDGVLVNVARGSLVDEAALIAALEAGGIAGAGLDVFENEPEVPRALRHMDHVVLAPHQGSATEAGRAAMGALVLANLDAHFSGKPLPTPLV
jgi:lactate dehydrogenase-like 2-hydroxyacid dehydrogenase